MTTIYLAVSWLADVLDMLNEVALPRVAQPARVGVAGRPGGRPHGRGGRHGSGRAWVQWRPAGRVRGRLDGCG